MVFGCGQHHFSLWAKSRVVPANPTAGSCCQGRLPARRLRSPREAGRGRTCYVGISVG